MSTVAVKMMKMRSQRRKENPGKRPFHTKHKQMHILLVERV